MACVDPSQRLLADIQVLLVDFFWDGLHWIPQSILHLSKDEGRQELVQLGSSYRAPAYRLNSTLYFMDTNTLDISRLPIFYHGLFKIWDCFKKWIKGYNTLHWLLEEPMVYGRLYISGVTSSTLSRTLVSAVIETLWQLVEFTGTDFSRAGDCISDRQPCRENFPPAFPCSGPGRIQRSLSGVWGRKGNGLLNRVRKAPIQSQCQRFK